MDEKKSSESVLGSSPNLTWIARLEWEPITFTCGYNTTIHVIAEKLVEEYERGGKEVKVALMLGRLKDILRR